MRLPKNPVPKPVAKVEIPAFPPDWQPRPRAAPQRRSRRGLL